MSHLLPDHLNISEYATKKDRSRRVIYNYIEKGKIEPDYVGTNRTPMINWQKYGNLDIPEGRNNKEKLAAKTNEKAKTKKTK